MSSFMPFYVLWAFPRHILLIYRVDNLSTTKLKHAHFISKHICFVNRETDSQLEFWDRLPAFPSACPEFPLHLAENPSMGHGLPSKFADDETYLFVFNWWGGLEEGGGEGISLYPVVSQEDSVHLTFRTPLTPTLSPALPLRSPPVSPTDSNGSWSPLSQITYFILALEYRLDILAVYYSPHLWDKRSEINNLRRTMYCLWGHYPPWGGAGGWGSIYGGRGLWQLFLTYSRQRWMLTPILPLPVSLFIWSKTSSWDSTAYTFSPKSVFSGDAFTDILKDVSPVTKGFFSFLK